MELENRTRIPKYVTDYLSLARQLILSAHPALVFTGRLGLGRLRAHPNLVSQERSCRRTNRCSFDVDIMPVILPVC